MTAADEILRLRSGRGGTVSALVAVDAAIDRALVEAVVLDGASVRVIDYVDIDRSERRENAGEDVLLVACEEYTDEIDRFVRVAHGQHPSRPVVLLCSVSTLNGYVSRAFDAGVDDLVRLPASMDSNAVSPSSRELLFAVEKALARRRGQVGAAEQRLGRMVCVLGLKGGSGKTLVSANLSVALAVAGHSVAIVDLDLQFGDVGLALGLRPERTLYDLVSSGGSLDAEKLEDFLVPHVTGARALLSPLRPDQAGFVAADYLREVYGVLRETHEFVIIDTPPGFTPEVIGAIDESTDVLMVAMRDSLSLKNTKLGLETLERMGYAGHVRVLLNRANSDVGIERSDVKAILGKDVDVFVPSHRDIARSMNRGDPIALQRRSVAAKAFQSLAGLYVTDAETARGVTGVVATKRRRPLFRSAR